MVLWSVIVACTYNLEDLNQVRKIDHKAQRTIQVGLKYLEINCPHQITLQLTTQWYFGTGFYSGISFVGMGST